jgi:hypothetical protein
MFFDVPENVVAVVLITPDHDGGYVATLGRVGQSTVSNRELAATLVDLVLRIPEVPA